MNKLRKKMKKNETIKKEKLMSLRRLLRKLRRLCEFVSEEKRKKKTF